MAEKNKNILREAIEMSDKLPPKRQFPTRTSFLCSGLQNLGNTCYYSSGLQFLLNNQNFLEIIRENQHDQLCKLLVEVFDSNGEESKVRELHKFCVSKEYCVAGNEQADTSQFIEAVFRHFDEFKIKNKLFQMEFRDGEKCNCRKGRIKLGKPYKGVVHSLKVHDKGSVMEAIPSLENYLVTKLFCKTCEKDKEYLTCLTGVPDNLLLRLDRGSNIQHKVFINPKITVVYTDEKEKTCDFPVVHYELAGFVVHSGASEHGGHYYACRKVREYFIEYNDDRLFAPSPVDLENYLGKSDNFGLRCQIAWYRRVDVNDNKYRRKISTRLQELSNVLTDFMEEKDLMEKKVHQNDQIIKKITDQINGYKKILKEYKQITTKKDLSDFKLMEFRGKELSNEVKSMKLEKEGIVENIERVEKEMETELKSMNKEGNALRVFISSTQKKIKSMEKESSRKKNEREEIIVGIKSANKSKQELEKQQKEMIKLLFLQKKKESDIKLEAEEFEKKSSGVKKTYENLKKTAKSIQREREMLMNLFYENKQKIEKLKVKKSHFQ